MATVSRLSEDALVEIFSHLVNMHDLQSTLLHRTEEGYPHLRGMATTVPACMEETVTRHKTHERLFYLKTGSHWRAEKAWGGELSPPFSVKYESSNGSVPCQIVHLYWRLMRAYAARFFHTCQYSNSAKLSVALDAYYHHRQTPRTSPGAFGPFKRPSHRDRWKGRQTIDTHSLVVYCLARVQPLGPRTRRCSHTGCRARAHISARNAAPGGTAHHHVQYDGLYPTDERGSSPPKEP